MGPQTLTHSCTNSDQLTDVALCDGPITTCSSCAVQLSSTCVIGRNREQRGRCISPPQSNMQPAGLLFSHINFPLTVSHIHNTRPKKLRVNVDTCCFVKFFFFFTTTFTCSLHGLTLCAPLSPSASSSSFQAVDQTTHRRNSQVAILAVGDG